MDSNDDLDLIRSRLDTLRPVTRAVFLLHRIDELGYDEITWRFGIDPAAWASLPADACALGTQGTAGADRVTRTSYDPESRVTLIEQAVGTPREQDYAAYTYSANGQRLSVKDANGNLASMSYDGFDRQTKWSFPSKTTAGQVNATDYEQYAYDPNSNRTSLRRRDGRTLTYSPNAF